MFYMILLFFIGCTFGSFYLLIATRLPLNEDVVKTRSHCDTCKKELKWYNLVPLFSYIFQRGKCTNCKSKINIIYPIIEVITGLLFMYMYYLYGFSYEMYVGIILSSLLVIISITDFKHFIILDSPLIVSSILIIILQIIYLETNTLLFNLLSGALLFTMMLLIGIFGKRIFKKDALGGGDVKLSFVIGLTLGFQLSMFVLIISAFLALPTSVASVLTTKNKEVPFGPFLAGSLLLVFLNYDKFIDLINYIIA